MIGLIGINHKTASVDERAQFALSPAEASMLIGDWQACGLLIGAVVLSTCNRMEIYYEAEGNCTASVERKIIDSLLRNLEVSPRLRGHLVTLREGDAMRHLFRLASGLESMVVGETQILGQLKDAYRYASDQGYASSVLMRLFHRAFEIAKLIRATHFISSNPLSAGSVAVDKLSADAPHLIKRNVLIIGAGQMAEKVLERLIELGSTHISVYNRTKERAERFASEHPSASVYCEGTLPDLIKQADCIFVATSAPSPIILPEHLAERSVPCYIYDLAVPRNVDERVAQIQGINLSSIDQLTDLGYSLSDSSLAEIDSLIDEHCALHQKWVEGAQLRQTIGTIQRAADVLLSRELDHLPVSLSPQERQLVGQWDEHLRITIATAIVSALREISHEGQRSRIVEMADQLFTHIIDKESK